MKLLPQYSLRFLLGITTVFAGVFSIVALAVRQYDWAIAVTLGMGAIVVLLGTYAVLFALLWVFAVVSAPITGRKLPPGKKTLIGTASPFGAELSTELVVEAVVVEEPQGQQPEEGGNP